MLGTVFRITPAGDETVLYAFNPLGLVDDPNTYPFFWLTQGSDGNFYGVTTDGISSEFGFGGEVFRVTPAGAETKVIQDDSGESPLAGGLTESTDGYLYGIKPPGDIYAYPVENDITSPATLNNVTLPPTGGSLIFSSILQARDGTFYITLPTGGAKELGVVLKVVAGTTTPFYSFGSVPDDALAPFAPLIEGTDGNLYGTTATGGPSAACPNGCGTVFKITPAGVETVLHPFGSNAADGQAPSGALVQGIDGNFYGTTASGGPSNDGTVFKLVIGAN